MANSLRIADFAERTGISTATVRYYEKIGVLPEPDRAANGYRTYDDRTIEQLRFIGRAKQLGCTLDEIADLVTAWNGGECGPVQDRLRALAATKLVAAQTEIVELITLTAELQRAASALEQHRPTGPCDDACGCVTQPADDTLPSTAVPIELTRRPDHGTPIACTLPPAQIPHRLDNWNQLLRDVRRLPIEDGLRLELSDDTDIAKVAGLAAAEQDCCRFFAFRLTIDHRGTALEVTAPGEALDLIHVAFGAPA